MKTCRDFVLLFSKGLDEELSTWRRLNLSLHRLMCRNCSRFFSQWELIESMLQDTEFESKTKAVELSEEARARIGGKLREKGL